METARRLVFGVPALAFAVLAAAAIGQETLPQTASNAPAPAERLKTRVGQEELGAALDRLVPRLMKDGDVPGLALAVVRDGRVFLRRDYGVKDTATGLPVDDSTVFEAASLSKPVFGSRGARRRATTR
jgi:CubicO group peptidase (beta-lactamase class C family)